MTYACTVCARRSDQRRCPRHRRAPNAPWSPNRDRAAQGRFRKLLVVRAGGRCEFEENGRRCTETRDLRACHFPPLRDGGGYEAADGLLLCRDHDRQTDPHAR